MNNIARERLLAGGNASRFLLIENEYKHLGLTAEVSDFWVFDKRNEGKTPIGPFVTAGVAGAMVSQLNDFVVRNNANGYTQNPFFATDHLGKRIS